MAGDVDLAGILGIGGRREDGVHGVDLILLATEVDLGRVPGEAEVPSAAGNPTSTEASISGREHGRARGCRPRKTTGCRSRCAHRENPVDAEELGGLRAEDGDRLVGVAVFRYEPCATLGPTGSRPSVAACTLSALVSTPGMNGLR